MELLLQLRYRTGRSVSHDDVRVDIDPEDTVAALSEALASHALRRSHVPQPAGAGVVRGDHGRPLDPADRIVDTGLVSGETVTLVEAPNRSSVRRWGAAPHPPPPTPPAAPGFTAARGRQASPSDLRASGGLTLDVTAGPGAGRVIPLRRDLVVGRADTCTAAIEDPTMSREHFAVRVATDGQVQVVPNPTATNGTRVADEELTEPRPLQLGVPIEAGSSIFVLRSGVGEETRRRDRLGQVPLNRVPYRRTVVWPQELDEVAPPPELQTPGKMSLAMAIMPAVSGVGMAVVFGSWFFLVIAAGSPIMLMLSHLSTKRGGKRRFRKERAAYRERLAEAAERLDEALEQERLRRLTAAPDLAELARQAMMHMPRLWERDRFAGDLLDLRLGLGELESEVSLRIGIGGDAGLRAEGEARLARQRTVRDVPVTVNLPDVGLAGLWGGPGHVASTGRSLVAQAACLHSPEDVVVVAAVGADALAGGPAGAWEWLKWLPHVRSTTSPLDGAHLAVGPDATRRLLVNLLAVAADRAERTRSSGADVWPRVLLVVEEAAEADRALLSQLLDVAPSLGMHLLWLGESELQVPRQCRAVVACPGEGRRGQLRFTDPARIDRIVELDGADPDTALSIARTLAPLRDASASSQTTAIPRIVPLFDVVGFGAGHAAAPTPDGVLARWREDRPYGLELPIGMSAEGVYQLDLVEQGPHTLIGGTSGAGKSELLQTLVLSLAANHPPTKLNFLFVDYKGGASSSELRDLPHTVGHVTNLSGRMSRRALTSLRAELQRRMALLEGKAKDLREMLTVDPGAAPPSLVIVVDEFATLVKEIPDFVAGMVDIAQRGRSLGVHLILATQRPTGVVDNNILANTNLRISLRVLDPSDSDNIIGTRDAASIPVPLRGRAYARTGHQTLVPFQCAWSGAPFSTAEQVRAVGVKPFAFVGEDGSADAGDVPDAGRGDDDAGTMPSTQLDALVASCAEAARAASLPPVRRPWLDPLPEVMPLDVVLDRCPADELQRDPGRRALLGMCDDPEHQAQPVASVDLEASGGLLVFGTGGSGKTTLLRTLAAGFARQGTPDEVQIYALDFASRSLDSLADLPHCGAVVAGDEVERTCRLVTILDQEIEARRHALAAARAENLGALRRRSGTAEMPRIVVLLDGYSGFYSTFDRADRYDWLTRFQRIVSAGRQVGVHCVLTTDRRSGLPAVLLSAIAARLVLRMASEDELSALGVPTAVAKGADLANGRAFLDGSTEVQIACASEDPSALAQSEAIAELAGKLAATTTERAVTLPELPSSFVLESSALPDRRPLTAGLGLKDLSLEPVVVDLQRQDLVVLGPPLSGKSTALTTVARGLRESTGDGVQLCAVGSAASPLRDLDVWDDAAFARGTHEEVLDRLYELVMTEDGPDPGAVLFVDGAEDVDNDALSVLETLGTLDSVRMVVASEGGTFSQAYTGWLAGLRSNRSVVMLQPESRQDVEAVVNLRPELRPDQELPPGRGILAANRRCHLVQVGISPPAAGAPDPADAAPAFDARPVRTR
jgi:DNA segregation ATPase FtsK/SpoIIIE, S-DNA-T family